MQCPRDNGSPWCRTCMHPGTACFMQAHMVQLPSTHQHQQTLCGWPAAPVHLRPQILQTPAGQAVAAGRQPAAGALWAGHHVQMADDTASDEARALCWAAAAVAAAVQSSERACLQASAQVWMYRLETLAASVACPLAAVESLAAVGQPGSCPLAIAAAAAAAAAVRMIVGQDVGPASVALGRLMDPLSLMLPVGLSASLAVAAGQKGATGCQEPQACSTRILYCLQECPHGWQAVYGTANAKHLVQHMKQHCCCCCRSHNLGFRLGTVIETHCRVLQGSG